MNRTTSPARGTEPLGSAECLDQLARAGVGYLATTDRALPVIVPVAISNEPGCLLLVPLFPEHRGDAPRPAFAQRDTVVALAVGDMTDGGTWCVVAQGVLRVDPTRPGAAQRRFQPEVVTGWRRSELLA